MENGHTTRQMAELPVSTGQWSLREILRPSLTNLTFYGVRMSGRNTWSSVGSGREKRFAYEDTHEWPLDDSLDYDFEEDGETEGLSLLQEMAQNWQTVFLRGVFILSACILLLMVLCCCANILCRVCCQSLKDNCVPCRGFLDILTSCYEDPMYKRARSLAEMMGIKLDYATYMKIKDRLELEGTGTYNPLGLPHME